jgi:homoprotocatechuate degradation regulator HpaR
MTAEKPAFLPTDVRHSLPMALLRARESVMRQFRPMLEAHGVNEQQWRVLRVLAEVEELDASEVAARANILAPSLTRMIRSMTDRGLIEKGRDDADARRVMLRITPDGMAVIRAAAPESRRIYAEIEVAFGHDRMAALVDLLNALCQLSPDEISARRTAGPEA